MKRMMVPVLARWASRNLDHGSRRKQAWRNRVEDVSWPAAMIVGMLLASGGGQPAESAFINTTGAYSKVVTTTNALPAVSTGTNRVYVQAGAVVNPAVAGTAAVVLSNGLAGLGRSTPKFPIINGRLFTNSNNLFNAAVSGANIFGNTTTATGSASWQSFVTADPGQPRGYGAIHVATGQVTSTGLLTPSPSGQSAAEAVDPLVFELTTAQNVVFDLTLGDPDSSFGLSSDSVDGANQLQIVAGFSGVSLGGMALDGDLFSLTIETMGIVSGVDDLSIAFTPWSGLGLSASDILDVESFVRAQFSLQGDGSVGFTSGASVPFFGTGGILPTVVFDAAPGTVVYQDRITSSVVLVPEPIMAPILALTLGSLWLLRRPSSRKNIRVLT